MAAVAVAHDPLSFEALTGELTALMREFPDQRTGKNSVYTMEEAALGAFSVFWTQSPSWLDHQRSMEQTKGRSNAQTLFGIERIPTDNCIRGLLDGVNPRYLFPMFGQVLGHLQAAGHLEPWRRLDGELLIALDGTQYHRSQAIHCEHCSKTEHRNGEVSYSHTVVTPVVVAPGRAQVIALAPEFVVPQDGHEKQDCETAAAKRWIATYGEGLQGLQVTLLGDDLYSRQPLCEAVLEAKLKFIFVAKPSSHITLYQWLEGLERAGAVGTHQVKWRRGKKHFTDTYRFASQLPLREGAGGLQVNWFEIHTTDEAGKTLYHNAWVTPHAVDAGNVAQRVEAGRARWKVESVPQAHREEVRYELTSCVKATWKMRAGPSESAFRSGLQTTPSCCGQEPLVVSVGVKESRTYLDQVRIRESNESEPSMTRRKPQTCRQNQGRLYLLGQACRAPDYWASGGRRIGGENLIQASVWNCGNQSLRCQGRSTSGRNHEARVPMRSTGADRPVVVMKAGNAAGAKGSNQAAAFGVQLATGGNG